MIPALQRADPADVRVLLGSGFAHCMPDRVEQRLGVDVIVADMAGSGYSVEVAGRTVVLAQRTTVWGRQNFTIAHELGHLAAGSLCDGSTPNAEGEKDASRFAAQLLAPRSDLLGVEWSGIDLRELAELIWEWGITTAALKVRLRSERIGCPTHVDDALGLSTPAFLRQYLARPGAGSLIADREKQSAAQRFPSELIDNLTQAVNRGAAPAASLAFALGVGVDDLEINPPELFDPRVDDLLDDLD